MPAEHIGPSGDAPLHGALRILESVTDGIHVFDGEYRITFINEPARELHRQRGVDPESLIGKRVFDQCYPEMRNDSWGRAFEKVSTERMPVEIEYYYGTWRKWYNSRFYPMADGGVVVFCCDITEKKIAQLQLHISHAVTSALAQAKTIEEVAQPILKAICNATDAEVAALWKLNKVANHLQCVESFVGNPARDGEFLRRTREMKLICGEGLPGRAWKERKAVWIADIATEDNFPRIAQAAAEHLHGAFALPILLDDEVFGVLEFFLAQVREPDPSLLDLMMSISLQIGQFLHRKNAEAAFRDSEDRFQMLANNISQLAWMADADGSVTWYNQRWFDYTGTTLEEMRGWGWTKVHHPEHVERVMEKLQFSWDSGIPWEDTFPLRGRDGTYRWFLSRASPIRDASGRIVHWFGTNTDITDLQQVQEALRSSEQRFRFMADACNALIWLVSGKSQDCWFNRAWLDFVGEPMQTEMERDWTRHVHPEDLENCMEAYHRASQASEPVEIQFRLRRRDGAYRWMLARTVPANGSGVSSDGFVGCCIDITDSRNRTEELERLVEERTARLRQSIHDLEILSYGIIHDLRAPLRSMHNWSELLLEEAGGSISAEGRRCINHILASSRRMDQLVQDVVAYGRVLRAEQRFDPIDTHQLVLEIIESYPDLLEKKSGITIVGRLPTVLGTEAALTQCLSNLLRNAVKFVPPGKHPQVRIGAEPANSAFISLNHFSSANGSFSTNHKPAAPWVRLWVEDNGIGIPREHFDRIFQMFQRLDLSYDGTGIGLSIVQKTVERLGGRVGLESEVGKGSRFWVELKAADERKREEGSPSYSSAVQQGAGT